MQLIAVKLFPNLVAVPIKSATKIFVGQKDRLRQWDCNITPSPRAAQGWGIIINMKMNFNTKIVSQFKQEDSVFKAISWL